MGNLSAFLKTNKKERKTVQYPATKSLCDSEGNPVLWTIRALSTRESESIREECSVEVPITGKPGMFRQRLDSHMYVVKTVCAAIVEPDLNSIELQDSYGVRCAEDLIMEMIDNPEEFGNLAAFVQEFGGLEESMQEKVDKAKN